MNQQFKLPALTAARTHRTNRWETIFDDSQQTMLIYNCRAEVLLGCFEAPGLDTEALTKFVGSLHGASDGNPTILPIVTAFQQWHHEDNDEREGAELERLWKFFDAGQPIPDPVPTLKMLCTSQALSLPDSMVHAIFDDASFSDIAKTLEAPDRADTEVALNAAAARLPHQDAWQTATLASLGATP